jgi:hypothetical protein
MEDRRYLLIELPPTNTSIEALASHYGWRTADVTDLLNEADRHTFWPLRFMVDRLDPS